jgi:hypothetical protein
VKNNILQQINSTAFSVALFFANMSFQDTDTQTNAVIPYLCGYETTFKVTFHVGILRV